MERRKFTRELKLEAVKLIRDRGAREAQASRDLGVHQTRLRSWLKAYGDYPVPAFPGRSQQKSGCAEVAQLKREVTNLKALRSPIELTAAYFAKESTCRPPRRCSKLCVPLVQNIRQASCNYWR